MIPAGAADLYRSEVQGTGEGTGGAARYGTAAAWREGRKEHA